ncbi:sugar phosphate isomerase/epimerase family protein [Coraliomargarita akajimensis]|uniref:Xylose isomerase domain protein TIM barrel n=1 Tax=Coraliomargarita akajimensis (strain DSM 45221 / IAM 15411 / JCM 23193 / KCTC 12865 / 04OKA010-24) TaxID=583355 RepID=D5ENR0_CORAD|nr:sugar phosphate isomerase/epimerase family protein [Coraliomargarita akajimensis]ADE53569.1 Xylose isomerase domain protein TIM barrel [Coraliomargarita akajimensis DSM 45221]
MKNKTSICTWSLQNDLQRVAYVMQQSGASKLHLDVAAYDTFVPAAEANGWTITAMMASFPQEDYSTLDSIKITGGIVPDAEWPLNRELAIEAIRKTSGLGIPYLSMHAGFMDHSDQHSYMVFGERLQQLADTAQTAGIRLLLETGQESARDLKRFLQEMNHPALGVNFDPANMILYGKGNPIEAIAELGPWIKHVHIKDATASPVAGEWGQEVPWGQGEVNTAGFFNALDSIGYRGDLAIEREAGEQREQDMIHAAKQLEVPV